MAFVFIVWNDDSEVHPANQIKQQAEVRLIFCVLTTLFSQIVIAWIELGTACMFGLLL